MYIVYFYGSANGTSIRSEFTEIFVAFEKYSKWK